MLQKKAIAILLPSLLGVLVHATESPTTPQVVGFRPVYSNTTGADSVSGKLEAGATLRVDPAKLHYQDADGDLEDPAAVRFSWLLDGVELAKSASVQLPASQDVVGKKLTLQVTPAALTGLPREGKPLALSDLRVAGATGGDVDGNITAAEDQTLVNGVTGKVVLSGTAETGKTLTATVTLTTSNGIAERDLSYRYQWSRGNTPQGQPQTLASKTHTYALTAADAGSIIQVETRPVYKTKLGNPWTAQTATAVTISAKDLVMGVTGNVALSGAAETGKTLTATVRLTNSNGIAERDLSYTYQWLRGTTQQGMPQTLASKSHTYPLTSADAGSIIKVQARPVYQGKQGNPWSDNSQTAVQMTQFRSIKAARVYYQIDEGFPKVGINGGAFVLQLQDNNPQDYTWSATGGARVDASGKVTLASARNWYQGSRTYTITATPKRAGAPTLSYVAAPSIWVSPHFISDGSANLAPATWADRHNNHCGGGARVTTEAEMRLMASEWGDPRKFTLAGYVSDERVWIDQSTPPSAAGDAYGWDLTGYLRAWPKATRNTVMCTKH